MFLQAMRHEKPTNVRLGNPSCDRSLTMRNNCTCSPLEDAFEDAFARGLRAGLSSDKVLGMKLPCMWSLVKYTHNQGMFIRGWGVLGF